MIYWAAILEKLVTNGLRAASALWVLSLTSGADASLLSIQWAATLGAWIYLFPTLVTQAFNFLSIPERFKISAIFFLLGAFFLGSGIFFGMTEKILCISSILIVLGTSFYRTDLPAILSRQLMEKNGNQQLSFTVFYSIMNVGTLIGILMIAVLGETKGWFYSELIVFAGTILLIFTSIMMAFRFRFLESERQAVQPKNWFLMAVLILSLFTTQYVGLWMNLLGLYFLYWIYTNKQWTFLKWALIHGLFWIVYDQASTTLVVLSDSAVDRSVQGLSDKSLPNTFFLLIDPIFNIVLGSVLAKLISRKKEQSPQLRSICFAAAGIVMVFTAFIIQIKMKLLYPAPMGEFIVMHLLFVLGEQLAVPTGLAFASGSKDPRSGMTRMGFWFLGISYFTWLSGKLGQYVFNLLLK